MSDQIPEKILTILKTKPETVETDVLRELSFLGNKEAMFALGKRLMESKKYDQGFNWIKKSCQSYKDDLVKYLSLAELYYEGTGTVQSTQKAIQTLMKIDHDPEACFRLSQYTLDHTISMKYLDKAASKGHALAQAELLPIRGLTTSEITKPRDKVLGQNHIYHWLLSCPSTYYVV